MKLPRGRALLFAAVLVTGVMALSVPQWAEEPASASLAAPWVYAVDEDDIERIRITHEGTTQGFIKMGGGWRSEDEPAVPVLQQRWGGVTLILRGLKATRALPSLPEPDKSYGLAAPVTRIELRLRGERSLVIDVGAANPAGTADYVRVAGQPTAYLVDRSWRAVLARLATEPPFAG